jgi:hypothetical protein
MAHVAALSDTKVSHLDCTKQSTTESESESKAYSHNFLKFVIKGVVMHMPLIVSDLHRITTAYFLLGRKNSSATPSVSTSDPANNDPQSQPQKSTPSRTRLSTALPIEEEQIITVQTPRSADYL